MRIKKKGIFLKTVAIVIGMGAVATLLLLLYIHTEFSLKKARKAEIVEVTKFSLENNKPYIKRELGMAPVVRIAPSGDKLAIIYALDTTILEENRKEEYHLCVLFKKGNRRLDLLLPQVKTIPSLNQAGQTLWWSPDSSKCLIRGTRKKPKEGGSSEVWWMVDVRERRPIFITEMVSGVFLNVYQPWDAKGDKFLWASCVCGKPNKPIKINLYVYDLNEQKSKEIKRYEFPYTSPIKINPIFASWNHKLGKIYTWQNGGELWEIDPNKQMSRKMLSLPSTSGSWFCSLFLPTSNMFFVDVALAPPDSPVADKWLFGIFDLRNSKFIYTNKYHIDMKSFEEDFSQRCYPEVRGRSIFLHPEENLFLALPWIYPHKEPYLVCVFDLSKGVKRTRIELPLGSSEEILDVSWGNDKNTIFIATCNTSTTKTEPLELTNPCEAPQLKKEEEPLKFIKLYTIRLKY